MDTMLFEQNICTTGIEDTMEQFAALGRDLVKQFVGRGIKNDSISMGGARVTNYFKTIECDTYEEDNRNFLNAIVEYSVKACGGDYKYESLKDLKNRQLAQDTRFISRFNAVLAEVINPVAADIISEAYNGLADTVYVDTGDTARFEVDSNETFYVSEIAEGVKAGAVQRLYKNEVTINPTPKQIRYELPMYQVAAGTFDIGAWMYKVGMSFAGYISAKTISGVTSALTGIPAAYKISGAFTESNFINISQRVSAANGGRRVQAWGTLSALAKVIPATAGLQYGLGEEIAKIGYLGTFKSVDLVEMKQVMEANTVNTTATLMLPDNILYFIPVGAYRPVKIAIEGNSVTVEKDGNKSSDKHLGLAITMRLGVKAVIGSIFGAYTING